jgi:hypothetical protein
VSHLILRGNALHIPLRDASVDLVVTSPPYFALRDYRDSGVSLEGQIGTESHPRLFLEALWAVMRELWRVLKPEGSCFVNLGDKRAGSGGHNNSGVSRHGLGASSLNGHGGDRSERDRQRVDATRRNAPDRYEQAHFGRRKSRQALPERFLIGCIDGLADPCVVHEGRHEWIPECRGVGWIWRSAGIWEKLNCLSGGTQLYARVKGRLLSIKVHDLCRAYRPEDVQLWNGERWSQVICWQPTGRHPEATESYRAIRAARKRGDEPAAAANIEVELRSGERIGCTREHRWPTQRGLVAAAYLKVGDVLQTAPLPDGETYPSGLDDEITGWFVGLYIAEGSRSEETIQIAGHVNELDRFKRLSAIASAYHGTCVAHPTGGQAATICLTGRMLHAILDTYVGGRLAKDKHLQPKVWQRSNRFLRAVLDGYLSGDGGYDRKNDRWQLGFTANDYLASDLRTLGARLGISVRLARCTVTGFGKEWPAWRGTILMDSQRRQRPDSQVIAIRQSRARQFWDIGVEDEPHLFALASGVLSHNSLPESVTDRFRDNWEHVYHLTKSERYFAAMDEIRKPYAAASIPRRERGREHVYVPDGQSRHNGLQEGFNKLGALPGSVWRIASEPLQLPDYFIEDEHGWREVWAGKPYKPKPEDDSGLFATGASDAPVYPGLVKLWRYGEHRLAEGHTELRLWSAQHFAAFPSRLPEMLIRGFAPTGICTACGEPRRPVVEKSYQTVVAPTSDRRVEHLGATGHGGRGRGNEAPYGNARSEATVLGYACRCPDTSAPTRKAVVFDSFCGTGTTPMVAEALGRIGIGMDLSEDYCRLARWRIEQSGHGAKAEARTWKDAQGSFL